MTLSALSLPKRCSGSWNGGVRPTLLFTDREPLQGLAHCLVGTLVCRNHHCNLTSALPFSSSERLKTAYGTDSGMVPHMVGFFFASISSIVMHWSGSEPELAAQVILTLWRHLPDIKPTSPCHKACELFLCLSKLPFRTVLLQLGRTPTFVCAPQAILPALSFG